MKKTLVKVSALALLTAPLYIGSARAQTLQISCKQSIDIGNLIASGCAGKYVISPDGVHKNSGCLLVINTAKAGSCTIKVTGGAATKSALVTFVKTMFTMNGTKGGATAKMDNLQMKMRTQPTIATKLTLGTPTLAATKVTIDIGGDLNYADMQTAGSYSGKVAVSVNF